MGDELAILSPQEAQQRKRLLKNAWEKYVSEQSVVPGLRGSVLESWKRSKSYGVQPEQLQARLSKPVDEVLEWAKESDFFQIAIPVLDHVYEKIQHTKHLLTLTDSHGCIVYLRGEPRVIDKAHLMQFTLGADWSEESAGTNAIGTAIYLQKPIQIFSYEHYAQGAHDWVCSAAPVHDPCTGELLGIIDFTAPHEYAQPHTLEMARIIALNLQTEYSRISLDTKNYLYEEYAKVRNRWPGEALLLFDRTLRIIAETPEARNFLCNLQHQFPGCSPRAVIRDALLACGGVTHTIELLDPKYKLTSMPVLRNGQQVGCIILLARDSQSRHTRGHRVTDNAINVNHPWRTIIGSSRVIQRAIQRAQIVAATNAPVLITGESGTGKELFARAIHEASPRGKQPFVAVNIAALPRELIASELFGYEPGAFTGAHPRGKKGKFEEANGGTLFLDEIGDMPLELQVYLLRVLQEKKITRLGSTTSEAVDVRIIAATNQNLAQRVANGEFRLDLFYRLNVVEIELPPLRDRLADVPSIAQHFLSLFAQKHDKSVERFDPEVLNLFKQYHWPGNVRELQNVIEYSVIFSETDSITVNDLPDYLTRSIFKNLEVSDKPIYDTIEMSDAIENEERRLIAYWLEKTNGNISQVARQLRRSRTTIYRKIKHYGLNFYKPLSE